MGNILIVLIKKMQVHTISENTLFWNMYIVIGQGQHKCIGLTTDIEYSSTYLHMNMCYIISAISATPAPLSTRTELWCECNYFKGYSSQSYEAGSQLIYRQRLIHPHSWTVVMSWRPKLLVCRLCLLELFVKPLAPQPCFIGFEPSKLHVYYLCQYSSVLEPHYGLAKQLLVLRSSSYQF